MKKPRRPNPLDDIFLAERIITSAEEDSNERFELPTKLARRLLELAKRARKTTRGRKEISSRQKLRDDLAVRRTKARKAELMRNEGLRAEEAGWKAAREVSKTSRLSCSELFDRQRRRNQRY